MIYASPPLWLPERRRVAPAIRVERIDLARSPDFVFESIAMRPSSREIERAGKREVLEPRVMQVLVALLEARGAVVSRQELVDRCWSGRAIGEDAIHRCIGKLRRLAEADGARSFAIETIPRVGYRLVMTEGPDVAAAAPPVTIDPSPVEKLRPAVSYRAMMPLVFVLLLVQQIGARLIGDASPALPVSDAMLILTLGGLALALVEWKTRT
jgi:DNA-binding winged helix-turn-helix (wHTH) protein